MGAAYSEYEKEEEEEEEECVCVRANAYVPTSREVIGPKWRRKSTTVSNAPILTLRGNGRSGRHRTRSREAPSRSGKTPRQRPGQWTFEWTNAEYEDLELPLSPAIVACLKSEENGGWRIVEEIGRGAFTVAFKVEKLGVLQPRAVLLRGNTWIYCESAAETDANRSMEAVQEAQDKGDLDTAYMMKIHQLIKCKARITEDKRFCPDNKDELNETWIFLVELLGETVTTRLVRIAKRYVGRGITGQALKVLINDGEWPQDNSMAEAISEMCGELHAIDTEYEALIDYLVSVNWHHDDLHASNLAYRPGSGRMVFIDLDSMEPFASEERMRGRMLLEIVRILRVVKPNVFIQAFDELRKLFRLCEERAAARMHI